MRSLIIRLARWVKHDPHWQLDPQVSTGAAVTMGLSALNKALHGALNRRRFRRSAGLLLMGRQVTIHNPRYISLGPQVIIEDFAEVQGISRQGIQIGDRVTIGRFAMIRPSGYYTGDIGEGLRIGNSSAIGAYCYIGCSGMVTIGDHVMLGPRVGIFAENHNYQDITRPIKDQGVTRAAVTIEDDCWIASNTTILAGVTIGRGSIVAAGSVVTHDVPPYSIVAGAPARLMRRRIALDDTRRTWQGSPVPLDLEEYLPLPSLDRAS